MPWWHAASNNKASPPSTPRGGPYTRWSMPSVLFSFCIVVSGTTIYPNSNWPAPNSPLGHGIVCLPIFDTTRSNRYTPAPIYTSNHRSHVQSFIVAPTLSSTPRYPAGGTSKHELPRVVLLLLVDTVQDPRSIALHWLATRFLHALRLTYPRGLGRPRCRRSKAARFPRSYFWLYCIYFWLALPRIMNQDALPR